MGFGSDFDSETGKALVANEATFEVILNFLTGNNSRSCNVIMDAAQKYAIEAGRLSVAAEQVKLAVTNGFLPSATIAFNAASMLTNIDVYNAALNAKKAALDAINSVGDVAEIAKQYQDLATSVVRTATASGDITKPNIANLIADKADAYLAVSDSYTAAVTSTEYAKMATTSSVFASTVAFATPFAFHANNFKSAANNFASAVNNFVSVVQRLAQGVQCILSLSYGGQTLKITPSEVGNTGYAIAFESVLCQVKCN